MNNYVEMCIGLKFCNDGSCKIEKCFEFSRDNIIEFILKNVDSIIVITDWAVTPIVRYQYNDIGFRDYTVCSFAVNKKYIRYFKKEIYPIIENKIRDKVVKTLKPEKPVAFLKEKH